jgi:DNA ligase (NAD+)
VSDKSAGNVIEAIEKSKTRPLWRLVAALGIRHIGGQSAQILAEYFGALDKVISAEQEELAEIDQIGPTMAKSVYEYFHNAKNMSVINQLLATGVMPEQSGTKRSGKMTGKTFVITGILEHFTRQQAEQAVRQMGGKPSSSVSKKTDFILAGKNPGSKLDKAQNFGIKIINEKEFLELLDN